MKYGLTDEQAEELRGFIAAFASAQARRRLLALINTKKGRQTIMSGLDHVTWLDPRCSTVVPFAAQTPHNIEQLLVTRGAQEVCHILSTDPGLNDKRMPLRAALSKVVDCGAGTIIFCIPGRLAYYESEEPQERYVCWK